MEYQGRKINSNGKKELGNEVDQTKGSFIQDNRSKTIQKKTNNTGLPNQLKSGIENLSGIDMSDTKVHYNSSKPAQLNAHAYAQGTDIHLASGQEKHLPHEAWHVVQQKQGRVRPTMQMKGQVNVNADAGLEQEADVMGAKALQTKSIHTKVSKRRPGSVIQRFPRHHEIVTRTGVISAHDLLQLLDQVVNVEIGNIHLRPNADWFRQFATLGDPAPYTFPAAVAPLSYDHAAVTHRMTVGGVNLARLGANNYIHAHGNPAGHDHTSYPQLNQHLARLGGGAPEIARARRIRGMLSAGVHLGAPGVAPVPGAVPGQNVHEAVATTALFGAETARAPRTFLSHMMNLDRLEAQQVYGAMGAKTLQLPTMLNPDKQPLGVGGPLESNNQHWARKLASLNARSPGRAAMITDVTGVTLNNSARRGLAPHGGKSSMAGFGTKGMGQAVIPLVGTINLVQAKEVNILIKWLNLQVGIAAFAAMDRASALARIRGLVEERSRNYYLMTQGENRQRMIRAIIMQQALHGLLKPRPMVVPVVRMPRGLFIRNIMVPALRNLPIGGNAAVETGPQLRGVQPQLGLRSAVVEHALVPHMGANLSESPHTIANVQQSFQQFQELTGQHFRINAHESVSDFLRNNFDNVTRAYRQTARRLHPDRNAEGGALFAEMQGLFDVLNQARHGNQHGAAAIALIEDGAGGMERSAPVPNFGEARIHLGTLERLSGTRVPFVLDLGSSIKEQLTRHWADVKRLYRKAALRHHPDKGGDSEVFKEVNNAFTSLEKIKDGIIGVERQLGGAQNTIGETPTIAN